MKPKLMKPLLGAAGILGLVLRAVLYSTGMDRKGLLIAGYWADTAVWIFTAAVALVLLCFCRQLADSDNQHAFPASFLSAAGAALAAIGFFLSPVSQTPSQLFTVIELALRYAAAVSLIVISYCRFRGKAPLFLLHTAVCLYLALRLVCQYRIWSADPQIQNYAFYLGAHVALMIAAYQFAAFDAGFGSHRKLWAAGLSAIYLSLISIVSSEEPFFLLCCAIWIWTNLIHPSGKPHKKHPRQEESQ